MKYKLLITGPKISDEAIKTLIENEFEIIYSLPYSSINDLKAISEKEQIDAILVRSGEVSREVIKASSKLRVIAKHGTGINNIDIQYATELKIPVFVTIYGNYQSVAEHTVALIYGLTKEIVYLDRRIREGYWDKSTHKVNELNKKTLGLIGMGRIARKVVDLVSPLNMNIYGYDPYVIDKNILRNVNMTDNLNELLKISDYVSIHCPLNAETKNLINKDKLKIMKRTAFIINTARGGIINENALIDALKNKWISGAGLDTYATEPPERDNPLWKMPNVILSPHIGGVTEESFVRMGMESVNHIMSVLKNKEIDFQACINPGVFD